MANLRVNKIAAVGVSTENTGSVYFDGTGDYLSVGKSGDFNFLHNGATDWTVEFWAYTGTATRQFVWGTGGSSAQTGFYLQIMSAADAQSDATGVFALVGRGAAGNYIGWGADNCLTVNTWHHIAAVFKSSDKTLALYVDGREVDNDAGTVNGTFAAGNYSSSNSSYALTIGKNIHGNSNFMNGYITNLRLCKGHRVYTSQFTPPTTELEVIGGTAFVGCYDGENLFAEKTGKVIAAYGDRLSSPTPTATDSPIGITTFNPGLTRSVDATAGPTFQGGVGFVSQNWLTLPKGTTTQRGRGRGLFGGGQTPSPTNSIDYIQIQTQGNAQDFGDLTLARHSLAAAASATRGLFGGGDPGTNVINFVTIASTGDAVDFGDLVAAEQDLGGAANNTRGLFFGGSPAENTIQYVTIASLGNAQDFGDLTRDERDQRGCGSPTRCIIFERDASIDFVTFATTGNGTDFGDTIAENYNISACSDSTRGIRIGGGASPSTSNEYITIATLGNSQNFGSLTATSNQGHAVSDSKRGVISLGDDGSRTNAMDYITIQTTGNAQDFGDLTAVRDNGASSSDSHGSIS